MPIIGRGFVEVFIAIGLMTFEGTIQYWSHSLLMILVYGVACFRAFFAYRLDLFLLIFAMAYTMQNFIVNCIDFVLFKSTMEFYND